MRSTWLAGVRDRTLEPLSFLVAGRLLLIRILPTAPSNPRAPEPLSAEKPGTRLTMSRAVLGRWAAKNSGWNTRTPRWLASSSGAVAVGPVGTGAWATCGVSAARALPVLRISAVVASRMVLVIRVPSDLVTGELPVWTLHLKLQAGKVDYISDIITGR